MSDDSGRFLEFARLDRKRTSEALDISELERWSALRQYFDGRFSSSVTASGRERRRSPRIRTRLRCVFKCFGSFERALITNVSSGGVFVRSSSPLPVGSRIFIRICIAETDAEIELPGKVVARNFKPDSETSELGMCVAFSVADEEVGRQVNALYARVVQGRAGHCDGEPEAGER